MSKMEELAVHKNELFKALGDNSAGYLNLLKLWFKCGLSKLDFDTEARKLLTRETIAFHNRFLVALFTRCNSLATKTSSSSPSDSSSCSPNQLSIIPNLGHHMTEPRKIISRSISAQPSLTITTTSAVTSAVTSATTAALDDRPRPKKLKTNKSSTKQTQKLIRLPEDQRFLSADHRQYTQKHPLRSISGLTKNSRIHFCSGERTLPDHFMSHLRLFVNVWEYGVDGITDEAILLTNLAIRDFIKNILTSILMFKSNNQNIDNGCNSNRCFQVNDYPDVDHFLINAEPLIKHPIDTGRVSLNECGDYGPEIQPSREMAIQEALLQIACAPQQKRHFRKNPNEGRIRLRHLHHALRLYRNTIPTHSVYTTNMERVQLRLGEEEIDEIDDDRLIV